MQLYRKLFGGMGLILFAFTTLAEPIIKNGNFEISSPNNDFPDRWKTIAKGGCNYIETTDAAGQATRCLEFTLDGKTTRIESSPILQAGRKYRLSADMKTENFKGGGGVYVTPLRWTWGETIRIPAGTTDWKKYTLEFVLNEKQEAAYRLILFANDTSRGKVWFDNVVLEPVATETAQQEAYISAGKMSQAPFLDGNLQDPGWESTVAASPFVKIGFYDYTAFAYEETSVRVGYDDQHLFFAFNCRQRCLEPARNALDDFRNDVTRHDGEMWKQDCVLMLLKTDAEDSFFEIIVNGAGTITDALCEGPDYWSSGRKVEWESHALAAVKVADGVWSAEVAIPLKQINLEAVQGTDFQVCLGRLNISGNERSSYFPMREGFHTPKFFGKVQFGSALQNLSDIKLGECKTGVNTFSFNGSSEKKDMLGLEIVTMDETAQEVPLRKIFQLSSQPETFPMEYICQGKEFSFMRFSFSNPEGTFLKSPQYSRVNNSQKISLITGEKTQNPVTLNNQPMNRTASGLGSTLHASCEPGLFDLQGLDHPFSLTANGFSLPKRNGGRDCKILIKSTKFWPEHNNQFHIAENSLQPFHVVLHNPYPGLISESYSFNLALPEEFKMVGVSGASHHYPNLPVTRLPDLLQQGKKFQHVQISVPGGLAYKPYYADADGMTLMIELPVSGGKFVRRASEFYAWAEYNGGKVVEAPQTISVDILPPLKGMVPKYFMTQIWGGRIVNLNDKDLMRTFVKKTAITAGFNNLQGGAELVEGTDMTTFAVLNLKTTWGKEANEFLQKYPELTLIDYLGDPAEQEAYNRVCSSILLENQEMRQIMFATMQNRYQQYDHINFDYEAPVTTGPLSCYCQRCLNHFRREAALPENTVLDYKTIQAQYQDLWTRFMNRKLAALTRIFLNLSHTLNKQLTFYSGYESPKTLVQYGVDWNLIGKEIDYALCGYRTSSQIIRNTIKALGKTPLITGVIASPWYFTSREESQQIDKAFAIKGIVLGSKGFLCYNLPQLDGRSYYAMSETAAILTRFEDILFFGKINNQWLHKVEGLADDQYALFESSGKKQRVLLIYNEDNQKSCPFSIGLQGQNLKVYDAATDQLLPLNEGTFSGTVKPEDFNAYLIEE